MTEKTKQLHGIFDTSELEKKFNEISIENANKVLALFVEENKRLKAEVENVLNEIFKKHPFGCNDNCIPAIEKELKRRLGIK